MPLFARVAHALPVLRMLRQSFLQLGDVTAGSIALVVVTAMLPIALSGGLFIAVRGRRTRLGRMDAAALVLALQGWIVLATWGLMPLRMWAI